MGADSSTAIKPPPSRSGDGKLLSHGRLREEIVSSSGVLATSGCLERILEEASKIQDIACEGLARESREIPSAVFFASSSRHCRGWESRAAEVREHMPILKEAGLERVVTGQGPFLMEAPETAAKQCGLQFLGVPLRPLSSEHKSRNGHAAQSVSCLCLGTRCSVFSSIGDVFFLLDGGMGTLYEAAYIVQRMQLQLHYGYEVERPFLHRAYAGHKDVDGSLLLPRIIAVGRSTRKLKTILRDMVEDGTCRPGDEDIVDVAETIEEAFELGAEHIRKVRAAISRLSA